VIHRCHITGACRAQPHLTECEAADFHLIFKRSHQHIKNSSRQINPLARIQGEPKCQPAVRHDVCGQLAEHNVLAAWAQFEGFASWYDQAVQSLHAGDLLFDNRFVKFDLIGGLRLSGCDGHGIGAAVSDAHIQGGRFAEHTAVIHRCHACRARYFIVKALAVDLPIVKCQARLKNPAAAHGPLEGQGKYALDRIGTFCEDGHHAGMIHIAPYAQDARIFDGVSLAVGDLDQHGRFAH